MRKIKILLNKLKFFDYFLIFSILILGIFIFLSLFRKTTYLEIVLKMYRDEWFIKQLKPGMKEKNIFGQTMAQIQAIKTYPTSDQKRWSHLKVKLKAIYSPGENSYVYKGKKILVGSYLELYINNLLIDGTIIKINDHQGKRNTFLIKAKGRLIDLNPAFPNTEGVVDYVANSIKEGMIMKDSLNFPAIKIDKKRTTEAKMITVNNLGQSLLSSNPLRKDVFLDLTIWADKIGDYYYLFGDENYPIIIGNDLPFTTNSNWVFITITEINDVKKDE